jgi:hypothetical protein
MFADAEFARLSYTQYEALYPRASAGEKYRTSSSRNIFRQSRATVSLRNYAFCKRLLPKGVEKNITRATHQHKFGLHCDIPIADRVSRINFIVSTRAVCRNQKSAI